MKKLNLIHIIIHSTLAIAVAILFVLHFSNGQKEEEGEEVTDIEKPLNLEGGESIEGKTVYINIDSLLPEYNKYIDLNDEFERKYKKHDATLKAEQRNLMKKMQELQNKYERVLITRSDFEAQAQQLQIEEQNLMQKNQTLSQELANENAVITNRIMEDIIGYLKEIQSKYNFEYVFTTTSSGPIVYGDKSLDITWDVIKGLNKKYSLERKTEK